MNSSFVTISIVASAALSLLICGCNSGESPQSSSSISNALVPIAELNPQQQVQKKRAVEAKEKLFAGLLGELTSSMVSNGPAKSIFVCKQKAPEIAKKVSDETGVRIGRTSFKLRNQQNAPPDWAKSFVEDHVENEVAVQLENKTLGVLLPIRLQSTCTLCHGDTQQVMPNVKAAIVTHYPNDQATGFKEGDIRGYFWVEVPEAEN